MRWFLNQKISIKLISSYVIVACIAGVIGFLGVSKLRQIDKADKAMYNLDTEPLGDLGTLGFTFQRSRVNLRGMLLDSDQRRAEVNAATIRKNDGVVREKLSALEKTIATETFRQEFDALRETIETYQPVRERIIEAALSGEREAALDIMRGEGLAYEKSIDQSLNALLELKVAEASAKTVANTATTRKAVIETVVGACFGMLVAVLLGIAMSALITKPLNRVVAVAQAITRGDLTQRIKLDHHDEMGLMADAMNSMADGLTNLIESMSRTSGQVASAAGHFSTSTDEIASAAEQMATQATAIATSSEEMSATSSEIAHNCTTAARQADSATNTTVNGAGIVQETIHVMTRIADLVHHSSEAVQRLGSRSDQIGEIIGTIEDIADQTSLLALNAAIEAARAGDQGRGFAVVAGEVKALATRTAKATKEIGAMIKAIQQETTDSVAAMKAGVMEVERGTNEARSSGGALQEILDGIKTLSQQINHIATASEEQSATTCTISRNIQNISDVITSTAKGTEESAIAARHLASLAEELNSLVGKFHLARSGAEKKTQGAIA
jgi:methyl-accepting chemotaxis protein